MLEWPVELVFGEGFVDAKVIVTKIDRGRLSIEPLNEANDSTRRTMEFVDAILFDRRRYKISTPPPAFVYEFCDTGDHARTSTETLGPHPG